MIRKIKGTYDVLPSEAHIWQYIESEARRISALFGFGEIRTPAFEAAELFCRGMGESTDVVQKEMYSVRAAGGGGDGSGEDGGEPQISSLTLRPEGTAGVARAVIENGLYGGAMPLKFYYIMNFFRHEAPQSGRSREYTSFGVEMFGAGGPAADAEVISLADMYLRGLGIGGGLTLHINSIGCPECRPAYRAELVDYFSKYKSDLCPVCLTRLEMNPLRLLDCKAESCKKIAAAAPRSIDRLCGDCAAHQTGLTAALDALGIEYIIDTGIVRGLDYYTRTVFEFISDKIGAQSTVCGGGRYDQLLGSLGGPALPAVGFGIGLTRLILAMEAVGSIPPVPEPPALYIAPLGGDAVCAALSICAKLRGAGVRAECGLLDKSLKAQMKYAGKIGARFVLPLGADELAAGKAQLRDMAGSSQEETCLDRLGEILSGKLGL